VRRLAAILLLAGCAGAALACGKYGPPVRSDRKDAPAQSEEQKSEEATP
jgi:hypothetical protein